MTTVDNKSDSETTMLYWAAVFLIIALVAAVFGFTGIAGTAVNIAWILFVVGLVVAVVFLIFSISLLPGLFGASLGNVEAFIPVQAKGTASLGSAGEAGAPVWMKNQYKEALARARAENKLVFINFTGYACTNCHWMKANMFPRPEVAGLLKDFVLVDLYTDGTDAVSEKNQQLEESRFKTVAIPYYAIVDPDENVIATFPGLTRNVGEFSGFLKTRAGAKVAVKL